MKLLLSILAAAAIAVAAVSLSSHSSSAPAARGPVAAERPPNVLYGHIRSMIRTGRRFEMRFDPAWWLTGVAAQRAALEDTGSSDVPNDYYIVEEGHRLLTFVVPANARVDILTGAAQHSTISAAELAQIVNGRNPRHRRLFEPRAGFWIRIGEKYPNGAVALFQQYQP
jgi:hypothetical protein